MGYTFSLYEVLSRTRLIAKKLLLLFIQMHKGTKSFLPF